ncbi:MAG: glutamine synthetase [Halieaceae bacterium]|jgi:glutamine synthetase
MSDDTLKQLDAFLLKYPDIEVFEVILPDLAGGLRGKWVARDKIHKVFGGGLKLPISSLGLDVWGRDHASVFEDGDGDGICRADINTLVSVPWLSRPTGQVLVSLDEIGGAVCSYDGRSIVQSLMARFDALGLTPVLASEMEFHLFRMENDHLGRPVHTQSDAIGGALNAGQTYGIDLMEDMGELMHAIRDACAEQNLPVDTLIKEAGPSQYEINLYHGDNALLAADQALMLERVIKGVAKQHDLRAAFMAKPFGDQAGNGMHVHCSLIDRNGDNAFNNNTDAGNELLRHAIAGCLDSMEDVMLLFAPNLNSYRRFHRGSHAPLAPTWGYENRTVSVRVPADSHEAMRIEHRVAGVDANSHLVIAAILAGMLHGIENKLDAPPAVEGSAYDQFPPTLPSHWPDALDKFSKSAFVEEYFSSDFRAVYTALKQQEQDEFDRVVTPLEYESNL